MRSPSLTSLWNCGCREENNRQLLDNVMFLKNFWFRLFMVGWLSQTLVAGCTDNTDAEKQTLQIDAAIQTNAKGLAITVIPMDNSDHNTKGYEKSLCINRLFKNVVAFNFDITNDSHADDGKIYVSKYDIPEDELVHVESYQVTAPIGLEKELCTLKRNRKRIKLFHSEAIYIDEENIYPASIVYRSDGIKALRVNCLVPKSDVRSMKKSCRRNVQTNIEKLRSAWKRAFSVTGATIPDCRNS